MTPDPITLPAEHVIPAWRNAFIATSDDDERSVLYRTVLCEWHPDGLRFVSTDTFVLVASFASTDREAARIQAPDHDEAPTGSVVAIAADKLMTDFLKHRASEVKAHHKAGLPADPVSVSFSVGTIDDPDTGQQRLDIGAQQHLIVSSDNERIALPIHDGEFPAWRTLLAGYKPSPRVRVQARPDLYRRIGQLDSLPYTDDDAWLQLTMANSGALVMVTGSGRVPLEGAFIPRREEPAEQTEAA